MVIAGFVLSVCALLFALYTYYQHDRKIKRQSTLLNEYQLKKMEEERVEAKTAIVEANAIRNEGGKRVIIVTNKGKSIAKAVNVTVSPHKGYDVILNPCPIDIRPQNSIEIVLIANINMPDKTELTFVWTEENDEYNRDTQTIQL